MLNTKTISPTSWKNLILLDSALKIIQEFKKNNIEFLVLKGLYFAFTIYPDPGQRPMADVDFLIKRKALPKIDEILTGLGYVETSPKGQRTYGCIVTFYKKNKIHVDINWNLCQYERFKGIINITDDFWKRACEFNLEGTLARTLSVEDHILYVSIHYSLLHLFEKAYINSIHDLFYLINDKSVDWQTIIANAYKYKIGIPLYYSLLKAGQITELKLPDFVLKNLKPHWLKKNIIDYLLHKHKNTSLRYLCQALMVGDSFDTFRVLWRALKGVPRVFWRFTSYKL